MQQDLHALAGWERKWGMEFHLQKCIVLTVRRSRSPIRHPYQLNGHVLELQDTTKYLGVNPGVAISLHCHGKNIDRLCKKAKSTLRFLRRNLKAGIEETKGNALFCVVRSNLNYCCSIWSPHIRYFFFFFFFFGKAEYGIFFFFFFWGGGGGGVVEYGWCTGFYFWWGRWVNTRCWGLVFVADKIDLLRQ